VTSYFATECHDLLRQAGPRIRGSLGVPAAHPGKWRPPRASSTDCHGLIARQGWIGVHHRAGITVGWDSVILPKTIVIEELSRVSGAMGAMVQASQLGVAKILHFGSETQKENWLPPLRAETACRQSQSTEPDSGGFVLGNGGHRGNATAMTTFSMAASLHRQQPTWATSTASWFAPGSGSRGLSAFLVGGRPGQACSLRPQKQSMGLHGFQLR